MSRKLQPDYVVYKTTDLSNGLIYVGYDSYNRSYYYGSGIRFNNALKVRIQNYITSILNETFDENNFKRYKNLYTSILFIKEILGQYKTREEMLNAEIYWIEKLNARDRNVGYNLAKGGQGGDTLTNHPNLDKIKIKISNYNQNRPPEVAQKISNSLMGHDVSYLTRNKIGKSNRETKKNNPASEELRKIRSINQKTLCDSLTEEERKEKFGLPGEKNGRFGKNLFNDWVEKYGIDEANRRQKASNDKMLETTKRNKLLKEQQNKQSEDNKDV